ncbi:hypothetical protein [Desulfonema limicola]|uniref:hypothetical protein n=1 Tax=Desulfonema limicola TaxID=45656 RepID=UPI001A9B6F5D|nr:hypothetical protein [Desulfonema limicola]
MKAKTIISGIIIISMIFGITGLSFAGRKGNHNNNKHAVKAGNFQDRQIDRIYHGIKTGKITKSEYKSLIREQERIKHAKKRALRDGRITKMEREKLNWMQKRASQNIYESKHNRRVPRDTGFHSWNQHYRK